MEIKRDNIRVKPSFADVDNAVSRFIGQSHCSLTALQNAFRPGTIISNENNERIAVVVTTCLDTSWDTAPVVTIEVEPFVVPPIR